MNYTETDQKQKTFWSMKKYILLMILCVICVFFLASGLLMSLTLRHYVKTAAIPEAVETIVLKNVKVYGKDGTRKTLAEYILDEYIQDNRVSVDEVQEVLNQGTFTDFIVKLTERYNQYLADGGEFPEIDAQEFIDLLEENADLIYEKTGLHFLAPDKEKLKNNLNQPLKLLNTVLAHTMYKGVKGFCLRTAVSFWIQPVLIILLTGAFVWMLMIQIKGRKRIGTTFKIFGITAGIPSIIIFLTGLLLSFVVYLLHLPTELGTALRGKTILFSGFGLLICIALVALGTLWNRIAKKFPRKELEKTPIPEEQFPENTEPEPEEIQRQFCRYCGKKLVNPNARFCYHCGKTQTEKNKQSV